MASTNQIDARAYVNGDWFMQEKANLFAREWLPICALAQIAEAGRFVAITAGGWPLVALRTQDLRVVSLRNTCRHQSMMVVEQANGQCDVLRCRYHGWTYDLDGHFISAPPLVAPADPAATKNHLESLRVAQWGGLVLANLDPRAAPLTVTHNIEPGALAHTASADLACNWKTYVEHRLAANPTMAFQWPLVFTAAIGAATYVELLIPRSFLRTRIVSYLFGDASAWAAVTKLAAEGKAGAEALQSAREAGDMTGTGAIDAFRARVAAGAAARS